MWCFRKVSFAGIVFLLLSGADAVAEGYIVGVGIEADSADGRAVSAFGDWGIGDSTWISATASAYEIDGVAGRRNTHLAGMGVDHWFEPLGIRIGASYWGDKDILDSNDLTASLYFRDESFLLSVDYERRDFDFVVLADFPTLRRTAEFSADGFGISSRFPLGDNSSVQFGGIVYEYSRDIRLQPDIDVLRFLSSSRLSMINSLIDHRISAGIEFEFGLRSLDLTAGSWQTAVDGGRVESISVGFLAPMSDRTDVELRFSFDNSKNYGHTAAISVFVYYFGGS
jgi:hypothetical protein